MASGGDAYEAWLEEDARDLAGCDVFNHTASNSGTGGTGDWQNDLDMDIIGAVYAVKTLTPQSIRVNTVSPGAIEYPGGKSKMIKGAMPKGSIGNDEEVVKGGFGPQFPDGLFVAQDGINDGAAQNFKMVPLAPIEAALAQ